MPGGCQRTCGLSGFASFITLIHWKIAPYPLDTHTERINDFFVFSDHSFSQSVNG
uniref:Uncharacterized protein n=1 Tax=Rhizophora mucronata TaxID=61149 RepID=A0A2P2P6A7_RHIMU